MSQTEEVPRDPQVTPAPRIRTRLEPDERREQILGVAAKAFRHQEYSTISLEEIANRAGVTRGLLHHYFGSKRALYLEVVERLVQIPPSAEIVPAGTSGTLREVLEVAVGRWMMLIETVGAKWIGAANSGAFAESDVDVILQRARDDLVNRMILELPFPQELDEELLRSSLRCYAALVRVATDEWLIAGSLDRAQTETFLLEALLAIATVIVPAMQE